MKYLYRNCITEEYYTVDHELTRDECYRGEPKYIDDPHPCLCDSFCGVIDSGEDLPADTRCDDCPISFRYELFKANSEILNIEHVYESSSQKGEPN